MPNKLTLYTIIAAFWCAFLVVLGVNLLGNFVMPHEEKLATFGYPIEALEEETGPVEAVAGGPRPDIVPLIIAAKAEDGTAVFRKCASCHTVDAGGKNLTGPNLHNVVGQPIGDHNGFKTSESLKAIGGNWTYQKLDDYLENPKRLAPKGVMSFAGLKKPAERAAVIKLLVANTTNPPPLEAAAPAAEAPAPAAAPEAPPAK